MAVEEAEAQGCPVKHDAPAGRPADAPPGCPAHAHSQNGVGKSTSEAQPPAAEPAVDAEAKPMKCPLGFGNDNTAKLDPLSCILCRTVMHDAVRTACGHRFCAFCIQPFRDCPLCGADCQPTEPDADMRGTVETYLDRHSRDHKMMGADRVTPQTAEAVQERPEAARASFFLQLGLRATAGGNHESALARLGACEAALQESRKPDGESHNDGALATQLGAVCGSQGDALQRLGETDRAADKYEQSTRHLEACSASSPEVRHALSVTHNKLGDLRYTQGELPAARAQYTAALDIRRSLAEAGGEDDLPARLDLAASLVKVADVCATQGDAGTAKGLDVEARDITNDVSSLITDADSPAASKLEGLLAYFKAVDAHVAQPQ